MSTPWSALADRLFYGASVMCAAAVFTLVYLVLDNTPPWLRLSAVIYQVTVERDVNGEVKLVSEVQGVAPGEVQRGASFIPVWSTTRRTRECDGDVQIDIVDVKDRLWPLYLRQAVASYRDDPVDPKKGILTAPPSAVDHGAAVGPAKFIVTTFWYCNWMQKYLRWRDLAIIQKGPTVQFRIVP